MVKISKSKKINRVKSKNDELLNKDKTYVCCPEGKKNKCNTRCDTLKISKELNKQIKDIFSSCEGQLLSDFDSSFYRPDGMDKKNMFSCFIYTSHEYLKRHGFFEDGLSIFKVGEYYKTLVNDLNEKWKYRGFDVYLDITNTEEYFLDIKFVLNENVLRTRLKEIENYIINSCG